MTTHAALRRKVIDIMFPYEPEADREIVARTNKKPDEVDAVIAAVGSSVIDEVMGMIEKHTNHYEYDDIVDIGGLEKALQSLKATYEGGKDEN